MNEELQQRLRAVNACQPADDFFSPRPVDEAWRVCEHGEWMLWLAGQLAKDPGWPSMKTVVLSVCDCMDAVLSHTNDPEPAEAASNIRSWCAEGISDTDFGTFAESFATDASVILEANPSIRTAEAAIWRAASEAVRTVLAVIADDTVALGRSAGLVGSYAAIVRTRIFGSSGMGKALEEYTKELADIVRQRIPEVPNC